MIAIDTNILIRLFQHDDNPVQTSISLDLVRDKAPLFINPIVLVEFVWVLNSKLNIENEKIHAMLVHLLMASEFEIFAREATERAIAQFGNGKPDFADCLIGELNRAMGCETTMTFDKDAAKTDPFTRLTG